MSDQADNLRQLVKARREWREPAVEPALRPAGIPRAARESSFVAEEQAKTRARPAWRGGGLLMALAVRWAVVRTQR
jgi:hypothetical protein